MRIEHVDQSLVAVSHKTVRILNENGEDVAVVKFVDDDTRVILEVSPYARDIHASPRASVCTAAITLHALATYLFDNASHIAGE